MLAEWVYGVTSGITSNDIVGATKWPDPSSGSASSGEQETVTVNALGQPLTMTDRNGTVHTLTYDILGRVTVDTVTTLGSGVDGSVRRVETAYDSQGNAYLLTTYDATTSGNIVTQVQRAFNGLGQMTREWQSHGGAVNTSTTPSVQYAYSEMPSGANHLRLTSITYPDGYVLTYNYASGLNGDISRLSSLSDASGTLESYDYLGLGTVVRRGRSQAGGVSMHLRDAFDGVGPGEAGDQYDGLDRFGRTTLVHWLRGDDDAVLDEFAYTYDRNSNRLTKDNAVNSDFDEAYTYDSLNQLTGFDRNSGDRTQAWDFDALGNWDSLTTDGGSPQTRTHNKQNELTAVSGATSPTFDANGNMTTDETGKQYVYDAWNRLKVVKNSGGSTLKSYVYDAMGRRVAETASGATTDLYYSADWQVLEERDTARTNDTKARYVWSPVYVDAMVLRDRDTADDGTLEERLWVQQDANWNVTALTNSSGTVVERYAYDPFGVVTVLNASWSSIGSSAYGWQYLHQGGRLDTTSGLYHFRMRDYSPTLGRWMSIDPIGHMSRDTNLYRYIHNNSTIYTDPSGLIARTINQTRDFTGSSLNYFIQNYEIDKAAQTGGLLSVSVAPPDSFEAIKNGLHMNAAHMIIKFKPYAENCCRNIGFINVIHDHSLGGKPYLSDKSKFLENGMSPEGSFIDRWEGETSPFYGNPIYSGNGNWDENPNQNVLVLGRGPKVAPPGKTAEFTDTPANNIVTRKGRGAYRVTFETAVICLETKEIYASIEWGFEIPDDPTNTKGINIYKPFVHASPSGTFWSAVKSYQEDVDINSRLRGNELLAIPRGEQRTLGNP